MYSLTHNRIRFKFPFTLVKSGEIVTLKLNSLNYNIMRVVFSFMSSRSTARRLILDDLALLVYLEKCSSLTYKHSKSSLTETTS